LTYIPYDHPRCKPSGEAPEIVAQGAYLDYSCSYRIALAGANVAPAAIQLAWRVDAAVGGGWQVQLRPPVVDSNDPPPWTDSPHPTATFQQQGPIAIDASPDIGDTLDATAKLTFKLRVYRLACGIDPQSVTLNVRVAATLPEVDGATVMAGAPDSQPFTLKPALAPIPEPSVSFSGSLDFGDVAVDATGVKTPPKPQTITVKVSELDQACGSWRLQLKAAPLDGSQNATIDASNLQLSSIDDHPLADGDCPLDTGCPIAVIPSGPDADPAATFNLGVSLVLPDQPRATTFNATLTASLTAASS
jgi:hypothetical protein